MYRNNRSRFAVIFFGFSLVFLFLFAVLVKVQIFQSKWLAMMAINQRAQKVTLSIPRGNIVDRSGFSLTNRERSLSLVIFPLAVENRKKVSEFLANYFNQSYGRVYKLISETVIPFKFARDLSPEDAQRIRKLRDKGVLLFEENLRYAKSENAAHVIGYINNVENKGVSGIEALMDDKLKAKGGKALAVFMDAHRKVIPGLGFRMQKNNNLFYKSDIALTLDHRIQSIVERVMDKRIRKGAVVVMDPYTGEILAMASRPNFDPNDMAAMLSKSNSSLINRAINTYSPGSVFKVFITAAALEEKTVSMDDRFYCPGFRMVGDANIKCWIYPAGHGWENFEQAFANSCNAAFIEVGLRLGKTRIYKYLDKFGFNQPVDLGLPGERRNSFADPNVLYAGDIANISLGQGQIQVSPLSMTKFICEVANGGYAIKPSIIRGSINSPVDGEQSGKQIISKPTVVLLKRLMNAVVDYGTGKKANVPGWESAGKTGTAQTGRRGVFGEGISHAWFIGYTPREEPRYVISVFVEDGGSGGAKAAPVFGEIGQKIMEEIH